MVKIQKGNDGIIFPISPQKKKTDRELLINKLLDEVKVEDYQYGADIQWETLTNSENIQEDNIVDLQHRIKPFTTDKITPKEITVKSSLQYEQVATEEAIARIVSELSKEEKIISILANEIANKLLEQMNTTEIAKFINKNSLEKVNPDFIYFKEHLLNYSAILQEIVNTSIRQATTNLLTKEF